MCRKPQILGFLKWFACILLLNVFPIMVFAQSEKELLAAQYLANNQYDKATILLEDLFQTSPTISNYNNLLECYIKLADFSGAEKLIKKALKLYPNTQRFFVDQGYLYRLQGKDVKADKVFDDLASVKDLNEQTVIELANAFLVRGEVKYAINACLQGRRDSKNPFLFGFELANIYEMQGDYTKMMQEYVNMLDYPLVSYSQMQAILQDKIAQDPEGKKTDRLRAELLRMVQKNPDNTVYSEMLLWLSIQQKDYEMAFIQAKALDKRYNQQGKRLIDLAEVAKDNAAYDVAINCYRTVLGVGKDNFYYIKAKIGLLEAEYLKITNTIGFTQKDILRAEQNFIEAINELGKSAVTAPLLLDLAHIQAFYLDKYIEPKELLEQLLATPQIPEQTKALCKIELADIMLMNDEPWEATLLYSQVEKAFKNEPIGHYAKFKNATLSYYIGEFEWAKAQLDVLKAATSKLIANDAMKLYLTIKDNISSDSSTIPLSMFSKAELLNYKHKTADAIALLDSIQSSFGGHPIIDDIILKKSQILIATGRYDKADSLLNLLAQNYSWGLLADEALFIRANLNEEKLNNPTLAMDLYKQILTEYPSSIYVVKARKRYRELRGDAIN